MTKINEYARALFLLSEEEGRCESILRDAEAVYSILSDNPEYEKLLDTPALKKDERLSLIDEAFGSLDGYLVNLIKILAEKRLIYTYSDVYSSYRALYLDSRGIIGATVVSAVPLTDAQRERLIKKIEKETGKTVTLTEEVDPAILGGLKLRYLNIQLDGSLKTQLEGLKRSLEDSIV